MTTDQPGAQTEDRSWARIPALEALGDQLQWAAVESIQARQRRSNTSWGVALVPLLGMLAVFLLVGVQTAPSADAVVIRAAGITLAHRTGHFSMTTTIVGTAGSNLAADLAIVSTGDYDRVTGRMRSTIDLGAVLGNQAAEVPGADGSVDAVADGSLLYLRSAVLTNGLPGHPQWVKVDTTKVRGLPVSGLDDSVTDPGDFLVALRGMETDARVVERRMITVDGVSVMTTHYQGTVSLRRAAAGLDAAEASRLHDGFSKLGVNEDQLGIPTEVWVDDGGEVRRVKTTLTVKGVGAGVTGTTTITAMDYSDFGSPEPIVIPTGSEVMDLTALVTDSLTGPLGGGSAAPAAGTGSSAIPEPTPPSTARTSTPPK